MWVSPRLGLGEFAEAAAAAAVDRRPSAEAPAPAPAGRSHRSLRARPGPRLNLYSPEAKQPRSIVRGQLEGARQSPAGPLVPGSGLGLYRTPPRRSHLRAAARAQSAAAVAPPHGAARVQPDGASAVGGRGTAATTAADAAAQSPSAPVAAGRRRPSSSRMHWGGAAKGPGAAAAVRCPGKGGADGCLPVTKATCQRD